MNPEITRDYVTRLLNAQRALLLAIRSYNNNLKQSHPELFYRIHRCVDSLMEANRLEAAFFEVEESVQSYKEIADHAEIDALNILGATLLAMRRALLGLSLVPDAVVVDGNRLPRLDDLACGANARAIVRGDASHPAISSASILAKTWRDQLMEQLDTRFPGYGFAIHKGYPTPRHLAALRQLGVSPVHRRSFGPVRSALSDS